MDSRRCGRCRYGLKLSELVTGCQYCNMTGKTKVAQVYKLLGIKEMNDEAREMLRPKKCIFFAWNGTTTRKGRAHGNTVYDWELALEMHKRGATTAEITKAIGANTRSPVYNWMRRAGLKPNSQDRDKIDKKEMKKLYYQGMTDKEISAELCCSLETVRLWRLSQKLEDNKKNREAAHGSN